MRTTYLLLLVYFLLAVISLVTLSSIAPHLFILQLIAFIIGAIIFLVTQQIPLFFWKKYHWVLYAGVIALLLTTLLLGQVTRGAVSWIPLGPVHFQPSQIAQPIVLLALAAFLEKHSLRNWSSLLKFGLLAFLPVGLILLEPDLGTTLVLSGAIAALFFFSDVKPILYLVAILGFIGVSTFAWLFVLKPYQKDRLLTFVNQSDTAGAGYNAYQSMIAVGAGQVNGRGLGHGVQSQLRFLPERQTDFIFASLAEETGFIGGSIVLLLYGIIVFHVFHTALSSRQIFNTFLAGSLIFLFILQVLINVGMNMSIMPITGITLPFISYGGSSIIGFSFLLGLLQRIIIEENRKKVGMIGMKN